MFGFEVAGFEEEVDERADGSVAAGVGGEEAVGVGGHEGEDVWVGVGGAGGEAGEFHGPQVVDVVAEEAGLGEGDAGEGRPFAEGGGFVAAAFDDVGDDQLGGEAVDERGGFAGDEGEVDAEAAGEGDAHDVGEVEGF